MDNIKHRTEMLARWRGGEFGSLMWEDVKKIAIVAKDMDDLIKRCQKWSAYKKAKNHG